MERFKSLVIHPFFITGWLALMTLCYFYVDRIVAKFFHSLEHSFWFEAAQTITAFGKGQYIIIPSIIFLIMAYCLLKNKQLSLYALFLVACATIPGLITTVIKIIVGRPRPSMYFYHDQYGFLFFETQAIYWSLPSGHATSITGFMMALSLLKPRGWPLIFMGIALLISLTRVTTFVHFVSDVMAGMLLGAITTIFIHKLFVKRYGMPAQFDWQLTFKKSL